MHCSAPQKLRFLTLIIALACLLLGIFPHNTLAIPSLQECSIDGTCAYVPNNQAVAVSPNFSDANPLCKQIKNNSCDGTADVMVPIKNQNEWTSFLTSNFVTAPSSCITISACPDYIAGGYGSCSAQCGVSAVTLTPTTCTNSITGASVSLSLCSNVGEQCNTIACTRGDGCNVASLPLPTATNSFVAWTNSGSPFGSSCAGGCTNPNPQTGTCNCPSGYIDAIDTNTGGSIGSEGCTGFTHTCISTCGGKFDQWSNGANAFGSSCSGGCSSQNPATRACTCPSGYYDGSQSNTGGSVGDEGCTGFTHACLPIPSGSCLTNDHTDYYNGETWRPGGMSPAGPTFQCYTTDPNTGAMQLDGATMGREMYSTLDKCSNGSVVDITSTSNSSFMFCNSCPAQDTNAAGEASCSTPPSGN